MLGEFLQWLMKHVAEDPEEIADCRKTECLAGNWNQCEWRHQGMSHGDEEKES